MLHAKEPLCVLGLVALVPALAGCSDGDDGYYVKCDLDYCSWFKGGHLVAVADINGDGDGFRNLAITDPWPGP